MHTLNLRERKLSALGQWRTTQSAGTLISLATHLFGVILFLLSSKGALEITTKCFSVQVRCSSMQGQINILERPAGAFAQLLNERKCDV